MTGPQRDLNILANDISIPVIISQCARWTCHWASFNKIDPFSSLGIFRFTKRKGISHYLSCRRGREEKIGGPLNFLLVEHGGP